MTLQLPTLEGRVLPSFPCDIDKKPLVKDWAQRATTSPGQFKILLGNQPLTLFGVPTGEISGFDVLDIDYPEGFNWIKQNPFAWGRVHHTRSGGLHYLFKHKSGLRNSASKIAPGVDIRADGGYVIWWPSTGFTPTGDALIDWPEEILAQLNRSKASSPVSSMVTPDQPASVYPEGDWLKFNECQEILAYDKLDQDIINEILLQLIAEGRSGVTMQGDVYTVKKFSRESKYAIQAAAQAFFRVAKASLGSRNSTLNAEAYGLGRIMAREWTSQRNIIRALWRGAIRCGLHRDDGHFQTINTIVSGLRAGFSNPYPDLEEKK